MLSTFLSEYWPALVLIVIMLAVTWWLACICKESQINDRITAAYADGCETGYRRGKLAGLNEGVQRYVDRMNVMTVDAIMKGTRN